MSAAKGRSGRPRRGQILVGRYRLEAKLGAGGHGEVWSAHDALTSGAVAIKLIWIQDRSSFARTRSELSILRMHRLPGVVRLLDEGSHAGMEFLVMELVRGGPFPGTHRRAKWEDIAHTTIAFVETLIRLHGVGVVHQDIKPENVLVDVDGRPTLLDFGVASDRLLSHGGEPAYLFGTLPYVAPERLRGGPATPHVDLYALGAMLFKAVTGRLPHRGADPATLAAACLHEPAPPVRSLAPRVPRAIAGLIDLLLDKDPRRRPRSADEVFGILVGLPRPAEVEAVWQRVRALTAAPPGAAGGSGQEPLDEERLAAMFTGPERLFHMRSRPARRLFEATGGSHERVVEEVQRWLRVGVAAWEGDRLIVAPDALDRWPAAGPEESRFERLLSDLAARPSTAVVVAIAGEAIESARSLLEGGRLDRSIDRLHEALLIVRRHAGRAARPAPALRRAEERLLSVWLDLALADGTAFVVSRVRHELGRAVTRTAAIERLDQLAEAALAFAAGGDRALRMLDAMPPFEEVALERRRQGLRALASRRCPREVEDAVIEEVTRWARGVGDVTTLARLTFWRGWWHYRRGRYADAARSHMEAAAHEPWRVARTSAELAAASALLEAFDFVGAAAMVGAAQSGARTLGSPLIEARAEWLSRAVTYRSGEDREPDADLLQALDHLDARDILATAHLTEAAFAYRRGRKDTAARLAQRAADLWRSLGDPSSLLIARCLALACGAGPPASGEPAELASQSVRCGVPGIGIQALGLLASACPETVAAHARAEDVVALTELVPREFQRRRMDVLSAEEGAALARAALQAGAAVRA